MLKDVTRRQETKIVKDALLAAGYTGVKVGHGTGSAYGWLDITITGIGANGNNRANVLAIAQKVTGRHGDYDGDICIEFRRGDN